MSEPNNRVYFRFHPNRPWHVGIEAHRHLYFAHCAVAATGKQLLDIQSTQPEDAKFCKTCQRVMRARNAALHRGEG